MTGPSTDMTVRLGNGEFAQSARVVLEGDVPSAVVLTDQAGTEHTIPASIGECELRAVTTRDTVGDGLDPDAITVTVATEYTLTYTLHILSLEAPEYR